MILTPYKRSTTNISLVSTFLSPYRIRNTVTNSSHLNVFFNNHSDIHAGEEIDLSLSYEPFVKSNNLTEQCCGR